MPAVGTSVFTEPADYQAGFRGAEIKVVLTRKGDFTARLTWVELPHLHLLHSRESLPRIVCIAPARKRVCVAFPTKFNRPVVWNGVALQSGDAGFHGRGECAHQRTSGPSEWAFILSSPGYLARYGKALTGLDLSPPVGGRVLRPSPIAAARLRRLHAKVCRLAETNPMVIGHRQVSRALQDDLLLALVNCLTTGRARDGAIPKRAHARIINLFEDLLASHFDRQLSTSNICASLGVSERTLRVCCAEFLGVSPGRYIRLRRLNLVRAALRRASPATASVAELARRYGFSELGRFAALYRSVFRESPSSTLRRPRSGTGPAPSAEFA
jgi:AraC-like DNA-binding protein